jgi:hypothetical protein
MIVDQVLMGPNSSPRPYRELRWVLQLRPDEVPRPMSRPPARPQLITNCCSQRVFSFYRTGVRGKAARVAELMASPACDPSAGRMNV